MTDTAPVRWGILGTGGITAKLLAGAATTPTAEVVAVGSRTDDRATEYAAEHGIERAHGSYEALLDDPEVDAIYIATPNSFHHQWTMQALAAGKHVLCEKPYTLNPADVDEAFDAADAAGLVLQEAFMWRHHPQADRLVELVAEIGELHTIRAAFNFVLGDPDDIRLRSDLDGGSLMDVGCYCVSGARLLTGEDPDEVYGTATFSKSDVDVRFAGILRFPGGVVATITSGFTTDHRGLEAIGTEGWVRASDPWQAQPARIERSDGSAIDYEWIDPYGRELEDMALAIRGEKPARLGRDDAFGQARTIAALHQSAANGAPVRL
jgi:xylose dehydrogenase (NAD/NADP)